MMKDCQPKHQNWLNLYVIYLNLTVHLENYHLPNELLGKASQVNLHFLTWIQLQQNPNLNITPKLDPNPINTK